MNDTNPRPFKPHVRSLREQRADEVRRLRAEGLKFREIGERLGISLKAAHNYYADPDGAKHRARRAARARRRDQAIAVYARAVIASIDEKRGHTA